MKKEELIEKIKERRKKLNLSIEEVVEKTKLHPLVIKSIEEGKWNEINPTYLKGFLKIYCSFLGVEFDESLFSDKESVKGKRILASYERKKDLVNKLSLFKKILLFFLLRYKLILVAFLVIAVLFFLTKIKINHPSNKPKKIPSSVVSSQEEVEVALIAKKDCFIKVKEEGKVIFEGLLKKGMRETWRAKELEFWISDGSAVILEVNGERQSPLTKLPKPIKSLKIKSGSITVIK